MRRPLELAIERLWDGAQADPGERVLLRLAGEADALRIEVDAPFFDDPPPSLPPGPCWGLWEHEVVELFVLGGDGSYTELELGPHGQHLLLRLRARREIVARELPLRYELLAPRKHPPGSLASGPRWMGTAWLPRALLPPPPHRINAYSIHGAGDARRYLAWEPVPGEVPDFHRLERFVAATLP